MASAARSSCATQPEISWPRVSGVASMQVRAADLHDVGEGLALVRERVAQLRHAREQVSLDRLDGGDVHGRREGVVRRLRTC